MDGNHDLTPNPQLRLMDEKIRRQRHRALGAVLKRHDRLGDLAVIRRPHDPGDVTERDVRGRGRIGPRRLFAERPRRPQIAEPDSLSFAHPTRYAAREVVVTLAASASSGEGRSEEGGST